MPLVANVALLYLLEQQTFGCMPLVANVALLYLLERQPVGGMPLVADVGSLLLNFTFLSNGLLVVCHWLPMLVHCCFTLLS